MSEVITFRVPDDAHRQLEAIAREHGLTVGPHAREVVLASLDSTDSRDDADRSGQAPVPERLSTVERHTLSMLHRIRAHQLGAAGDGDVDWEQERALILERGWVLEYPDLFIRIHSELPKRDCGLVMDVLDMFDQLETAFLRLDDAERASLGEHADYAVRFRGFDANDSYESSLRTYAQHLIADGRWTSLAYHFEDDAPHDRGNSHMPTIDTYRRMLDAFTPLSRGRMRMLNRDEIAKVLAARVHPSNRG